MTISGHDTSLTQPQKSTSPTQLGTYGPGYFIAPWDLLVISPCSAGDQLVIAW